MGLFSRQKTSQQEPLDPNERSPQLGIKYKDLEVLGTLMASGAKLTEPRHVLYYLYFPSSTVAEQAAASGSAAGYECVAREPQQGLGGQWAVVCERADVVLDPRAVNSADDLFQGLADRFGGDFDGWEASV